MLGVEWNGLVRDANVAPGTGGVGIDLGKLGPLSFRLVAGTTATAALTDTRKAILFYNGSPATLTVDTNANVPFVAGDTIWVGSALSAMTIVGAGGVTITGAGPNSLAASQLGILYCNGGNGWTFMAFNANLAGGDVTTSGLVATIGANKVVNSMLATMANKTFKGRHTAGTGNAEDVSVANLRADLSTVLDGCTRNFEGVVQVGAQAVSANRSHYSRVYHARSGNVTSVDFMVASASGNVDVAAYPNSGSGLTQTPGSKYASSGSTACPSGAASVTIASSAVVEGDWFGFAADNGTATFRSSGVNASANNGLMWFKASDFPLPTAPSSLSAGHGGPVLEAH